MMSGQSEVKDSEPVLSVRGLKTHFYTDEGTVKATDGISYDLLRGETLGIVGESGSGKSVSAMSLLNLIESPGRIEEGEIRYMGRDLRELSEKEMRNIRGNEISLVMQDPMSALNPVYTIGFQISRVLRKHQDLSKNEARKRATELIEEMGIPEPESRIDEYPHQLSGGMRQRVLIAMAMACEPQVLILDEPTTALDVTIEAQIFELIEKLQANREMSVLLITHDLGVVAGVCDRVAVFYAGRIVERAPVNKLYEEPKHPYTRGLLRSIPRLRTHKTRLTPIDGTVPTPTNLPSGCSFHPRCPHATEECRQFDPELRTVAPEIEAACIHVEGYDIENLSEKGATESLSTSDDLARIPEDFRWETSPNPSDSSLESKEETGTSIDKKPLLRVNSLSKHFKLNDNLLNRLFENDQSVEAVTDVSFEIYDGEILGLVGESGSGKTTVGESILRLIEPTSGSVKFADKDLTSLSKSELREYRKRMQVIFQDPASSLNRRKTAGQIIKQPMKIHGLYNGHRDERVNELMGRVGLSPESSNRYPHEFSGGQRQRIGIARALAVEPDFIVADEPVTALDVSIQAQILNLLADLQNEFDLTMLFIAHDLSVIKHICDRVAVMYLGEIVEIAETDNLFRNLQHPYTESLLNAIPEPNPKLSKTRTALSGEVPSPIDPPTGCSFHPRCPKATEQCSITDPRLKQVEGAPEGHQAACIHVEEYEPGKGINYNINR